MDKKEAAKQVTIQSLYPWKEDLLPIGGGKLKGRCPFHADNRVHNFFIYTVTNSWYCFSTNCHTGGDAISFYMKLHNVDFKTALKEMTK